MKHILYLLFVLISFGGFSQNIKVVGPDTTTGRPGYLFTLRPQYLQSPLYAVNDSTSGSHAIDSLKFSGDSVYGYKDGQFIYQYKITGFGTGTVTSVDASGGTTGMSFTGGPITGSGTLTLNGTLIVANGGTGVTSSTAYGVIHAGTTSTGAFQNSGTPGTSGYVYTSTGPTSLPTWQAASGGASLDSIAIKRYGHTYANNLRSFDGGARLAEAQFVASSLTAATADSINYFIGHGSGDSAMAAWGNISLGTDGLRRIKNAYWNTNVGHLGIASNSSVTTLSGIGNTGMGYGNLIGLTTASSNSIFGAFGGEVNITGSGLTGLGYKVLSSATAGPNTAIGPFAGNLLTTGTNNIIGWNGTAVGGGISGAASNNTTFGGWAGTANQRVMIGTTTTTASPGLASVTIGPEWGGLNPLSTLLPTNGVLIGGGVAYTHSGGGTPNYATVVGTGSHQNITGGFNTVVGAQSLMTAAFNSSSIAAVGNTVMGYLSFRSLTGTPSYNVGIGHSIDPISLSGSNQFVLGANSVRWMVSDVSGSARRWVINGSTTTVSATTASAALDIQSTLGGLKIPTQTGTQRDAISSPATGLLAYNSDNRAISQYNGTNWTNDLIVSAAGTLTLKQGNDYVFNGTTTTWTLPAISANVIGRQNRILIKNIGSGAITLNTASGNTLYTTAATNTITINAGAACELLPDGTYNLVLYNL